MIVAFSPSWRIFVPQVVRINKLANLLFLQVLYVGRFVAFFFNANILEGKGQCDPFSEGPDETSARVSTISRGLLLACLLLQTFVRLVITFNKPILHGL